MADLAALARDLDIARLNLAAARQRLVTLLAPVAAEGGIASMLGVLEEYGVAHVLDLAATRPADVGLRTAPLPSVIKAVELELEVMRDLNERMDQLVADREAVLVKTDPTRLPVFQAWGREFVVDTRLMQMREADAGAWEPLHLHEVNPNRQITRPRSRRR